MKRKIRNTSKQENKSTSEKDKPQRIHLQREATKTSRPSKVNTRRNDIYVVGDSLLYKINEHRLRTTVPFVTSHLEIFHCTHHPVIPKSDLYFTFCSTLNALSKRTSK